MNYLNEEEVISIMKIFEESNFDYMNLEWGDVKIIISKSGNTSHFRNDKQVVPDDIDANQKTPTVIGNNNEGQIENNECKKSSANIISSSTDKQSVHDNQDANANLVPIKSPMVGIFYSRPEPGTEPYVSIGKLVNEKDTVGLIEVMKVFNSVMAGVNGKIKKILVENEQLVEYGQVLFLVEPENGDVY